MLTQDPLGLAGGVNLYEYAGSNPVSFDDPFGLCPIPPWTCFAVGAVVVSRVVASPAGQRLAERGATLSARASNQLAGMTARLGNIMGELATHDHLQAARLERTGRLVTGYDHAGELQGFANGLRNMTVTLKNFVGDQRLSEGVRQEAVELLKRVSPLLDEIKEALR